MSNDATIALEMLSNQPVAIKFVSQILYFHSSITQSFLAVQEPRKPPAPQLQNEFRSYRTLDGTRTCLSISTTRMR